MKPNAIDTLLHSSFDSTSGFGALEGAAGKAGLGSASGLIIAVQGEIVHSGVFEGATVGDLARYLVRHSPPGSWRVGLFFKLDSEGRMEAFQEMEKAQVAAVQECSDLWQVFLEPELESLLLNFAEGWPLGTPIESDFEGAAEPYLAEIPWGAPVAIGGALEVRCRLPSDRIVTETVSVRQPACHGSLLEDVHRSFLKHFDVDSDKQFFIALTRAIGQQTWTLVYD